VWAFLLMDNEAKTHAHDLKVLAVIDTDFPTASTST